jgi:hypothetical protein
MMDSAADISLLHVNPAEHIQAKLLLPVALYICHFIISSMVEKTII